MVTQAGTTAQDRPLFRQYPDLANAFPCLPLADLPTPLSHCPGIRPNLWIKNDGATSSLYGGNKVRKLEFILPAVRAQGKSHVVTFGGTGTNHGLATALFCREHNLRCTLLLFDQHQNASAIANYRRLEETGAELVHCGSVFRTALAFYVFQRLRRPGAYFLFAGGSNIEGCIGFVNAAFELKLQCDCMGHAYPDALLVAAGSNGTVAGLTLGCHLAGLPTRVIGVRTTESHLGPIPTCTQGAVTSLMHKTLAGIRRHQQGIDPDLPEATLLDDYFGAGYGVETAAGNAATTEFAQHGLKLEPTYTAKAGAAALDHADAHPGDNTLFWLTCSQHEGPEREQTRR